MILLAILIISAAVAAFCAIGLLMSSNRGSKHNPWMRRTKISMVIFLIISLVVIIASVCMQSNVDRLNTTYEDLMLYHYVVTNSTNEMLRYTYWEDVTAYNIFYEAVENQMDSLWFGALYEEDCLKDIHPIHFELHGDGYVHGQG